LIPAVGAVNRPPARFGRGAGHSGQCRACCHKQRELKGRSTMHEVTAFFPDDVLRPAYICLSIRNH
jgi:hypothetical protein